MDNPSDVAANLAADLLRIGAVRFSPDEPFIWTSGLRSPVYCDNRLTIGHVDVRRRIRDGFLQLLERLEAAPDVVAGTATAGIPHAAWLADALDRPMVYVRNRPKAHGAGAQVEGAFDVGRSVVLVEDLVSTGGSSIAAARALQEAGLDVAGIIAIFSYGLPVADEAFAMSGLTLHNLTDLEHLIDEAERSGYLGREEVAAIRGWRRDPHGWSDAVTKRIFDEG